ncbi:MAG: tol-pal system protein YbgF [Gammaproteobacteria bacterium]
MLSLANGRGRNASLALAGGLLFACSLNAWAVEDLNDLSTKERIVRLEQLLENQGLADIVLRLDSIQREMQRLHGELEVQAHTLEVLQNSQREANQELERRLRDMEQRASGISPTPPMPALPDQAAGEPDAPLSDIIDGVAGGAENPGTANNPGTPPTQAADSAAGPGPDAALPPGGASDTAELTAYQEAFTLLKKGQYDKAITGFTNYLTRYPQGKNADNAQYWLGEAYYVKRNFKQAQQAFETLLNRYPNTSKRADATLKLGFIHYEQGRWGDARKSLDDVKTNYPGTSAAQLAENRLQKMKKEGH